MTTRYHSLQEFRNATLRAREDRDALGKEISHHWSYLQDPATRGMLFRDAAGDALRSWAPYRRVHDLLNGHISGSTVSAIGMTFASMQRGFMKRMLYSGISLLLGKVIGDEPEREGEPSLLATLATTIGGVVRGMRERKAARDEEPEAEETQPTGL